MVSASLLFASTTCSIIVAFMIGRLVGMKRILQRNPLIPSLFTSRSHTAVVNPSLSSSFAFDAKHKGIPVAKETVRSITQIAEVNKWNQTLVHSGTCQSLGVDIDKLDQQFLRSSTSMERIMAEIVSDEAFDKSYMVRVPQCESIQTHTGSTTEHRRLRCNVLLSNSHLYIYTWPLPGVMSIDIFSCNAEDKLISMIPTIRELIATSLRSLPDVREESMVRWHYKLRGDRSEDGNSAYMHGDMDQFLCSYIDFDVKEMIASIDTEYQTIDIYDTIDPRFKTRAQYYASLEQDDESYYSTHPELFRPDRIIYLDGILQSRYYGDAAYHEPLVHPAMFTHVNPKRVAIIGGGEGATLREVLKHNTIETVTMIEIDELMVNVSKQFIPEWSDCSLIVGSTPSCFDDPRAELFYTDGIAWFIDRYLNADTIDEGLLYDIIIMDALDPESSTEFSTELYDTDDFMKSISNALRADGILVTQLGENFHYDGSGFHYSIKKIEYDFMQNLIKYGFDRMEDYTEAHGGFSAEWKYKILFKCGECNYSRWHSTQASVELEMKKRSMKCMSDCSLFRFFDGATMMGYQYVSRVNEAVFCRDMPQNLPDRQELWCDNRHGYDPEMIHVSSYLLTHDSKFDTSNGAKWTADIVEMRPSLLSNFSYVGLDVSAQNIMVLPAATKVIRQMSNESNLFNVQDIANKRWNLFISLFDSFCVPCVYWGSSCYFISLRLLMTPTNSHAAIELSTKNSFDMLKREGLLPYVSFSLHTVIYNPFISRNHFNFQWIHEIMKSTTSKGSGNVFTAPPQ